MITNELPWDSRGCGPPCISLPWHTTAIIMLSKTTLYSSLTKYRERCEKIAPCACLSFRSCACLESQLIYAGKRTIMRCCCRTCDNWVSVWTQQMMKQPISDYFKPSVAKREGSGSPGLKRWGYSVPHLYIFATFSNVYPLIIQFRPQVGIVLLHVCSSLSCWFKPFVPFEMCTRAEANPSG